MQRVRLYFLDSTIIDGFIEGTASGDIRLIDLLNSQGNRRRIGTAECITVQNGVQMLFRKRERQNEQTGDQLEFLEENTETDGQEVPLDFILNEGLELQKTINLENQDYTVNIRQLVYAHSLSEFKGVQQERKRALKTAVPFDVHVVTANQYLCEGKIMVPSINRQLPRDLQVGKPFIVLSQVKLRYIPSRKNLYRFHDHLIVNTELIKAFY